MRDTFPLLVKTDFPAIRRRKLETLQANLGYRCNQSCFHCHVAAGPKRTEEMSWATMSVLLDFARRQAVQTLDLLDADLSGRPIRVADHCYGCTAGQGSSCGGALDQVESSRQRLSVAAL